MSQEGSCGGVPGVAVGTFASCITDAVRTS